MVNSISKKVSLDDKLEGTLVNSVSQSVLCETCFSFFIYSIFLISNSEYMSSYFFFKSLLAINELILVEESYVVVFCVNN